MADIAILRHNAYALLAVTPDAVAMSPQITPELAAIEKTMKRAGQPADRRNRTTQHPHDSTERITITDTTTQDRSLPYGPGSDLRREWPTYLASSISIDARKVLFAYNSIPAILRRAVPIEAFCLAASVSPLSILSILVAEIVRRGAAARTIIAMLNQPRVIQKSVDMALTDDGIADRELLAKATGFLPAAKGAQTVIQVAANASSTSAAQSISATAPPPEQTIRRLVDRFNDATRLGDNQLAALPAAPSLPTTIPSARPADIVTLDVPLYDDDEDDDDR